MIKSHGQKNEVDIFRKINFKPGILEFEVRYIPRDQIGLIVMQFLYHGFICYFIKFEHLSEKEIE